MALTRLGGANAISGTIPQGNIANASLGAITALPAAITTGKVLQVVSSENHYTHSTTSTSMVDIESASGTAWETSITPSATSSKIIIMGNLLMTFEQAAANNRGELSTNIKIGSGSYSNLQQGMLGNYDYGGSGCQSRQRVQMQFITSPSSTDVCKVKFQMKATSGTAVNFNDNNAILDSTCILYEVAG